jgi:ArsR family transcriptional regulator
MHISPQTLFAALAHATRLRCLMLMLEHDELCVCELTQALGTTQPHISRHLAQLRRVGLVADRRDGLWIHYRLSPELAPWVLRLLREAQSGLGGERPFADDRAAVAPAAVRGSARLCQ